MLQIHDNTVCLYKSFHVGLQNKTSTITIKTSLQNLKTAHHILSVSNSTFSMDRWIEVTKWLKICNAHWQVKLKMHSSLTSSQTWWLALSKCWNANYNRIVTGQLNRLCSWRNQNRHRPTTSLLSKPWVWLIISSTELRMQPLASLIASWSQDRTMIDDLYILLFIFPGGICDSDQIWS